MPYNQDQHGDRRRGGRPPVNHGGAYGAAGAGDPGRRAQGMPRLRQSDVNGHGQGHTAYRPGQSSARPHLDERGPMSAPRPRVAGASGAARPRHDMGAPRTQAPRPSAYQGSRRADQPHYGSPRQGGVSRPSASRPGTVRAGAPRPSAGRPSPSRPSVGGRARQNASQRYAVPQPTGRRARSDRRPSRQDNRLAGGMAVLASGIKGGSRSGDLRGGHRQDSSGARSVVLGIVIVAVVAIVGVLLWSNRKVSITLNGEETSVRVGSTCEQVIQTAGLSPKAGNLVSVSGKRLEEGSGYAFTASLNGNELSEDDANGYHASDGDTLDITDGGDRMEDYDVQVMDEQPQLEMGGDAWGNLSYVSQWPKAGQYEMRTGKRSGETARGDTLEETQDAIVSIHQIKPDDDSKKLVALTFDDGPAEGYTEKYLDILDKYGIHATFFNLGQNIEEYPDLSKEICDRGSEVMSHTYQHQQLSKLDADALQKEFSSTFSTIESTTGVKTTGFRPPYGDFTEKAWLNSGGLASVSVLWNQDSLDWKRPGVDAIVANSTKDVTSGSIILMHDGGGNRDQDVEALPQIIEKLQADGYEFVTVSELMKSDSSIPEDIANGDATMPDDSVWPTQIKSGDSSGDSSDSSGSGSSDGSGSND